MVGDEVGCLLKPEPGQGGQDAAFVGDTGRQDHVEGRNPVGGDNQQRIAEVVNIAHFALDKRGQAGNGGG